MNTTAQVHEKLSDYGREIDALLKKLLAEQPAMDMYGHIAYALGFCDEQLRPVEGYGGKRFRPALCMLLAEGYGKREAGVPVAASIELFHNFTLIHDDIVDGDAYRRGRKSVWNAFGTDHAINSGDCMAILAYRVLADAYADAVLHDPAVLSFIYEQYQRVGEGQHLDFILTDKQLGEDGVNEDAYLAMISRKTAALVSAATKGAGLAAGVSEKEVQALYDFGQDLGIAYQIYDDTTSIWALSETTGKQEHGDIYTRKKTLPVFYALHNLDSKEREELIALYNREEALSEKDAADVVALLDSVGTRTAMVKRINEYAKAAKDAIGTLSLREEERELLTNACDMLLPDTPNV